MDIIRSHSVMDGPSTRGKGRGDASMPREDERIELESDGQLMKSSTFLWGSKTGANI